MKPAIGSSVEPSHQCYKICKYSASQKSSPSFAIFSLIIMVNLH